MGNKKSTVLNEETELQPLPRTKSVCEQMKAVPIALCKSFNGIKGDIQKCRQILNLMAIVPTALCAWNRDEIDGLIHLIEMTQPLMERMVVVSDTEDEHEMIHYYIPNPTDDPIQDRDDSMEDTEEMMEETDPIKDEYTTTTTDIDTDAGRMIVDTPKYARNYATDDGNKSEYGQGMVIETSGKNVICNNENKNDDRDKGINNMEMSHIHDFIHFETKEEYKYNYNGSAHRDAMDKIYEYNVDFMRAIECKSDKSNRYRNNNDRNNPHFGNTIQVRFLIEDILYNSAHSIFQIKT